MQSKREEQRALLQIDEHESAAATARRADLAGLRLPFIVKDAAACGVPEAHQMALISAWAGLEDPAQRRSILQGYVDHNGCLYKVYVLDKLVSRKCS